MANNKCPIHRTVENCVEFRYNHLRIAIAIAILKNKPTSRSQSAKDFVINLQAAIRNQDARWKAEYYQLKQEIQLLRQQQILLLGSRFPGQRNNEITFTNTVQSKDVDVLSLTPPDTQQPVSKSKDRDSQISFLRAYFYLDHQLRAQPTDFMEDNVIHSSICAILSHAEHSIMQEQSDFLKCMESLNICVQLLNSQKKWSTRIFHDKFKETSSSWLNSLKTSEHKASKYSSLLQMLANSKFAPYLYPLVLDCIDEAQKSLSNWNFTGDLTPRCVSNDFITASHYFVLMETLIPHLEPGDKKKCLARLPQINQNVQLHFPLFAASLMRCTYALEK